MDSIPRLQDSNLFTTATSHDAPRQDVKHLIGVFVHFLNHAPTGLQGRQMDLSAPRAVFWSKEFLHFHICVPRRHEFLTLPFAHYCYILSFSSLAYLAIQIVIVWIPAASTTLCRTT
jgi:hypothetical protein